MRPAAGLAKAQQTLPQQSRTCAAVPGRRGTSTTSALGSVHASTSPLSWHCWHSSSSLHRASAPRKHVLVAAAQHNSGWGRVVAHVLGFAVAGTCCMLAAPEALASPSDLAADRNAAGREGAPRQLPNHPQAPPRAFPPVAAVRVPPAHLALCFSSPGITPTMPSGPAGGAAAGARDERCGEGGGSYRRIRSVRRAAGSDGGLGALGGPARTSLVHDCLNGQGAEAHTPAGQPETPGACQSQSGGGRAACKPLS